MAGIEADKVDGMTVRKTISIESGRGSENSQGSNFASNSKQDKYNSDYRDRKAEAVRLFFRMGSGVWKVHRAMGVSTQDVEREVRELGFAEFERRERRGRAA